MKLDRNITNPKRGKYALIKLRDPDAILDADFTDEQTGFAGCNLVATLSIDYGDTPETDFFVIRLKDKYAAHALNAYARAAACDDPEYAGEIIELARLAAKNPHKKRPD